MSDVQAVQDEFAGAAERVEELAELFGEDPGRALAEMTWLGLMLAQRCQKLTEGVTVMPEGEARFFSMEGLLCGPSGSAVTIDRDHFAILRGGSRDGDQG